MSWFEKQKARHEASKAEPRASLSETMTQTFQDAGGDRARKGETWRLVTGDAVVIRSEASWKASGLLGASRVKVKVTILSTGRKTEVLASQLVRSHAPA